MSEYKFTSTLSSVSFGQHQRICGVRVAVARSLYRYSDLRRRPTQSLSILAVMPLNQGWRNDSRDGGGGLGSGGPRGKGSSSVSKGPKPPIQLLQLLKKQSKRSKKGPFSLYIVPPGSHPGSEINGARR